MGKRIALTAALMSMALAAPVWAQGGGGAAPPRTGGGAPNHPTIQFEGQSFTPAGILARNMGTDAEQTEQFPPHQIIGNVYYVGT